MMRWLLSRGTALGVVGLLTAAMVLSFVVPQRFSTPPLRLEQWREAHPRFAPLAEALGLDRVFTTPWLTLLVLVFLVAVCTSLSRQVAAARSRGRRPPSASGPWETVPKTLAAAVSATRQAGFRTAAETPGAVRMERATAGRWGNVLLHAGFVVAIGSALVVLCTQQRTLLRIEEGEVVAPPTPWASEEHGILARPFELPGALRLDVLRLAFWETDDVRSLESDLTLSRPDRSPETIRIGINEARWLGSTRVFQTGEAGHNFRLVFDDGAGRLVEQALSFQLPPRRDAASYNDFQLPWMPFLLRGKYFADVEKQAMTGIPLLVLRLVEGDRLLGEASLTPGASGALGPYRVTLVSTARWGGLAFFDSWGMAGLFAAFGVICLGAAVHYFVVPREVHLREVEGGCGVRYEAARFREFFDAERDALLERLRAPASGRETS